MLQTLRAPTLPDRGAQPPAPGPDYISPEELLKIFTGFLHRQYRVIGVAFLLVMALAAVYLYTSPPGFTPVATLMIHSRKVQLFQQQSQQMVLGDDSCSVDSQAEILKSEHVSLAS